MENGHFCGVDSGVNVSSFLIWSRGNPGSVRYSRVLCLNITIEQAIIIECLISGLDMVWAEGKWTSMKSVLTHDCWIPLKEESGVKREDSWQYCAQIKWDAKEEVSSVELAR